MNRHNEVATERDAVREYVFNAVSYDAAECACGGGGWILSPYDTFEACPVTAHAGPHPDDC